MILPIKVDKTPEGKIVKRANVGEEGYAPNVEFTLQIHPTDRGFVILDYYGEDGSYLTEREVFEVSRKASELI